MGGRSVLFMIFSLNTSNEKQQSHLGFVIAKSFYKLVIL